MYAAAAPAVISAGLLLASLAPDAPSIRAAASLKRRKPRVFAFFERLVDPFPDATPHPAPRGFFAFLWAASKGLRKYLLPR